MDNLIQPLGRHLVGLRQVLHNGFRADVLETAEGQSGEPQARFILHTAAPAHYWVGVCLPLTEPGASRPWPVTLLLVSDSLSAGGLFFDPTPWVIVGFGALIFSVLFWIPLVRGVTRSLAQMTRATEQISEGRFEARVDDRRGDELGRLGQAVNRMAARLAGFVTGQKRFLGDIAHELCSPIARIQVALGILEQRYAGHTGPITVAALRQDGWVVVAVADQGPGVPEASLQQIFDPFFRAEPSRSRDTGGVGLGLAIVKTCVEACQGTVSARNRAPRGLEVQIVLKPAAGCQT